MEFVVPISISLILEAVPFNPRWVFRYIQMINHTCFCNVCFRYPYCVWRFQYWKASAALLILQPASTVLLVLVFSELGCFWWRSPCFSLFFRCVPACINLAHMFIAWLLLLEFTVAARALRHRWVSLAWKRCRARLVLSVLEVTCLPFLAAM